MSLLIRGGRVFDPARKLDKIADVLVEDGKPGRLTEMRAWQSEGGRQIPIIAVPKDAKGVLDRPALDSLVQEWLGQEEGVAK